MDKITIYTNETCPYCKAIKDEFEKENVKFDEKLTKDYISKWDSIVYLTGIPSVPTIEYNNEYFVPGREFHNPKQLIEALRNWKKSPYSQTKIVFERMKSLSYNISTAFQRMDQLLRQIENKLNTEENEHKSTS